MNATRDLFLFLGLFIGVFIIWVVSGGPERAAQQQQGVFVEPRQTSGTGIQVGSYDPGQPSRTSGPTRPQTQEQVRSKREVERELDRISRTIERVRADVSALERFGAASTYEGSVLLSGTFGARRSSPSEEYLELRVTREADTDINISGWQIESAITGYRVTIGEGATLPRTGRINATEPIRIAAGERAILSTGFSPIGSSFRTNTCTGYFAQFQEFNPRLTRQCPTPEQEFEDFAPQSLVLETDDEDNDDRGDCREFIDRMRRCEIATVNLDTVEPDLTSACQTFIENELTYSGCVANHRTDADFYDDTWRVYLQSNAELWNNERDVIKLLDRQGRTVDLISY